MTTPEPVNEQPRRTVNVPIRRGDGVFTPDEYAEVDVDAADHWDARIWRDHPL
ncbi:hypothetical protein [Mycobacterium camsae]|uniref:hypothetical protein n=1 Tax=Mycobacterium gordonae TaxID=1778 RepID=UPI00198059C6|nr:hypothetical protein [Mycobacterium gordonae]